MAEKPNFAPYAPTKTVMRSIEQHREFNLPQPLDAPALETVGVPATMAPRTLQALRFLGLIDQGGNATETFDRLKRASTEEYQAHLAEVVRNAYLPIFNILDPVKASDTQIGDAFRRYEPSNQRAKMISLFRGLCGVAGITEDKPKQRSGGRKPTAQRAKGATQGVSSSSTSTTEPPPPPEDGVVDLRVITAVVQRLPRVPKWTSEQRSRWLQAMTSALDLTFDVEGGGG